MAKDRLKKKPTAKELGNAIIDINNRVNQNTSLLRQFDEVLGLYITMKGDLEKFNKFLNEEMEKRKNESEANGETDKEDIPENTENKGSRTERVREKAE